RRPQPVGAAVGVTVEVGRRPLERLERRRQRRERALVRRELDDAVDPELALHLLDRLPGLVRDERVDGGAEEAGHGHYCTAVTEIGLFPLDLVLLPTERIPLHIFEER